MDLQAFLSQLTVGDIGFAGLVSLAIFLIYTGRLVPRRTLDDAREDRDGWKEAYKTLETGLTELTAISRQSLEYAKTSDHLIKSMQGNREPHRESVTE